jgi:hypothetical protein
MDDPIFTTLASDLIFFYLDHLMPFMPFASKYFDLQIFEYSSFLGFALKLSKPDSPE